MEKNMQQNLKMGSLDLVLHRTIRVKYEDISFLPPSLGYFDLCPVKDHKCPTYWDKDGYFIAMHEKEAMWISFRPDDNPVAIIIGASSINAVDGKTLSLKLEAGNYMVSPPQPWIDGWKNTDGTVSQFVGVIHGEGKSVGEQLGSTSTELTIALFEAKDPSKLVDKCCTPKEKGGMLSLCCLSPEVSLGKGGKIGQHVYEDPYGIESWKEQPDQLVKIYMLDAKQFSEITGTPMPPLPKSFKDYQGYWFGVDDEHLKDVAGSQVFDSLKKVENSD